MYNRENKLKIEVGRDSAACSWEKDLDCIYTVSNSTNHLCSDRKKTT